MPRPRSTCRIARCLNPVDYRGTQCPECQAQPEGKGKSGKRLTPVAPHDKMTKNIRRKNSEDDQR